MSIRKNMTELVKKVSFEAFFLCIFEAIQTGMTFAFY
jgi:hypothetical protein